MLLFEQHFFKVILYKLEAQIHYYDFGFLKQAHKQKPFQA